MILTYCCKLDRIIYVCKTICVHVHHIPRVEQNGASSGFPSYFSCKELILQLLELTNAPIPVGSVGLKDAHYQNELSAEYNSVLKYMYSHVKHKEPHLQ